MTQGSGPLEPAGATGPHGFRVLVITPTYNERESLPGTAGRLRAAEPDVDLLVVDDSSPDGTGDLADAMAAQDDRVHVLHRTEKAGLGQAYVAGFAWGIERGYDVLVEMDADGSHQPEQLRLLLDRLAEGADLVLGSRWVPGGSVVNWPRHRLLLSRGGNTYARWSLGIPLRDATGGFRAYRREVLEKIALDTVASQGYCFQVDLAWRTLQAGFEVAEVPITFVERVAGRSKMSQQIVLEALWRLTRWGVERRVQRARGILRGRRGGGPPP
ncbi:polyprenol monophosphomannose synthase [Thalassiella azotivora]